MDYLATTPQTIPVPQGQGHRQELQEARHRHRSLHVHRLPGGQELQPACATRTGTPRPTPTARRCSDGYDVSQNVNADDIDNRIQRRRPRHRVLQPRRLPGGAWSCTDQPDAEGAAGQPEPGAALVHQHQPDGEAVRQHRLPQGDRVRHGPHRLPGRLRRQARRRRHRHHDADPDHPGLQEVRPLPDQGRQGRPDQGQGRADEVRAAERLLHEHLLPDRAPAREGDRGGVPAAAGQDRHQAHPEGLSRRPTTSPPTPATRRT